MAKIEVSPEELIAHFRADWPLQFEITTLRMLTVKQERHIAEMEHHEHTHQTDD